MLRQVVLVVLVVISALAGTGRVKAQEAIAVLEWVEAGDVNAPNECAWEGLELPICTESRRVCLNAGGFVLAVNTHGDQDDPLDIGSAAVTTDQSEDVEDRAPGNTPGWVFSGMYPGNVLIAQTAAGNGWNWTTFYVAEPQCYSVTAVDGRARLYKLRVAVPW